MSWAGCQNNPIDINFHLQKSLEIFEKKSADKIWSNKDKGIKMSPHPHTHTCQIGLKLAKNGNAIDVDNKKMAKWVVIKSERDFHFSSTCVFTCFLWDIHIFINFSNLKKMIRENTKGLLSFSSSELIETYCEWQSNIYYNTSIITHFPINCLSKSERKLIARYLHLFTALQYLQYIYSDKINWRFLFCYQTLFWPFVRINCSSDLKIFANSRPSTSNFKSFSLVNLLSKQKHNTRAKYMCIKFFF